VAAGEEVAIVKRGQTVARQLPASRWKRKPVKMPDVAARLKKVFGNKIISDRDMRKLWAENRGGF
jgi:antitoxin (DNA-binding transcriptional repressor) of toxin-antitoxin stability system